MRYNGDALAANITKAALSHGSNRNRKGFERKAGLGITLPVILCLLGACLFAGILLPGNAESETFVDKDITVDTTWTYTNSPYVIIGNIAVKTSATLTIEPGVVIKSAAGFTLNIEGNLSAIGTSSSIITFTSNKLSPAPGTIIQLNSPGISIQHLP